MAAVESKAICVIGGGLVGTAWTALFVSQGYSVRVYDPLITQPNWDILAHKAAAAASLLNDGQEAFDTSLWPSRVAASVSFHSELKEALWGRHSEASLFYVQECVPERLDLKAAVFAQLDKLFVQQAGLSADWAERVAQVGVGSSSSTLPISAFTATLCHRSQFFVVHPINPPHLMPLVELVPSADTNSALLTRIADWMRSLGKKPVILRKEQPGFALNYLQYAVLQAAMQLVEHGVLSAAEVDTVMVHGLAPRYSFLGPFATIDLNAPGGIQDYCNRYLDGMYAVTALQDPNQRVSAETIAQMNGQFREQYPLEDLPARAAWRDERLLAYFKAQRGLPKPPQASPSSFQS